MSAERAEPMLGTASRVGRWLLVEHPGAWGPATLPLRRLPPAVAAALPGTAAGHGARLLLVRRPPGAARPSGRHVFAVDSRPGHEGSWQRRVEHDDELLDLGAPYGGQGWRPRDRPLYLVCTHGRNDRCCALRGRPVALTLAAARPEQTWECTHVGGDRFAANLLVLPDGLYLGRVTPADVVALVEGLEAGMLPPGSLRGRSSLTLPAQAAQVAAREQLSRHGSADLLPLTQQDRGPDRWRLLLSGDGGLPDVEVDVRYDREQPRVVLSCGDPAKVAPVFVADQVRVLLR